MGQLNKQQQILLDITRSLEHTASALEKQAARLAHCGAMPPYIRALIVTAQSALEDACAGLAEVATDAPAHDDTNPIEEHTRTLELDLGELADEDAIN